MPAVNEEGTSRRARAALLAGAGASLALIAIKTLNYAPFSSLPGAKALVIEPVILFLAYGLVFAWPDGSRMALRPVYATVLGICASFVQAIHLIVERFVVLPPPWEARLTLSFMLATFLFWAAAGFQSRKRGLSFNTGCAASIWSAMVTMTIAMLFGIVLTWWIAPVPLESMRAWAEFQRSGWNDLYAFSIANVLDSASSHLLAGPLIACLFGSAGYGVAHLIISAPPLHARPRP